MIACTLGARRVTRQPSRPASCALRRMISMADSGRPSSASARAMSSVQASVASITACSNSVPSFDSSVAISRKRVRAGSSRATPERRKSRSESSTMVRCARVSWSKSGRSRTARTASYSARFWPSALEKSVISSSASP